VPAFKTIVVNIAKLPELLRPLAATKQSIGQKLSSHGGTVPDTAHCGSPFDAAAKSRFRGKIRVRK
jgi:hypothetical protein